MILKILGHRFHYEIENLCRVFYPFEKIRTVFIDEPHDDPRNVTTVLAKQAGRIQMLVRAQIDGDLKEEKCLLDADEGENEQERRMAVALYRVLSECTGYLPGWGILTGVRPSKLMSTLIAAQGEEEAKRRFSLDLLVSEEKTELSFQVAKVEEGIIKESAPDRFSLYVSIPFCPTRCSYCSFVSHSIANSNAKKLVPVYVENLCRELEETGRTAEELGLSLDTVYIGGGTPTSLDEDSLEKVLTALDGCFSIGSVKEYTVEAGRPDTVNEAKLKILKNHAVSRISVNPQSFNDEVLEAAGRKHTAKDAYDAYRLAKKMGFQAINMDLITGLPKDSTAGFGKSLDAALALSPENITVHTLALKRSAFLSRRPAGFPDAEDVADMLDMCYGRLPETGYLPYYMYRQSRSLGNLENVGWCKPGREGRYNVVMMEECQTVLSAGAGAVTKLKQPNGSVIERIFNFKYPYEYNSRFDEIIKRKSRITDFFKTYK